MEVVVIDFETTGLDPDRHRAVQVGLVWTDRWYTEQWTSLIRPDGGETDPQAMAVNGIRLGELKAAPPEADVFRVLRQALMPSAARPDVVLVAHHIPFDLGFLLAGFRRHGLPEWRGDFICTRSLFALLHPGRSAKLADAAAFLGIAMWQHHKALDDAWTAFRILRELLPEARRRGIDPRNVLVQFPDRPLTWAPDWARVVDAA